MRILSTESEITTAQLKFKTAISGLAAGIVPTRIGHPVGVEQANVHWLEDHGVWAHFGRLPGGKSTGKRYWNVFGIGMPGNLASIACEINPPLRGIRRFPQGAFGEANNQVHVLHRGIFNAFRGKIPRAYTRKEFPGAWVRAQDGDCETDFLMVGAIEDPDFAERLAVFVKRSHRLKESFKGRV